MCFQTNLLNKYRISLKVIINFDQVFLVDSDGDTFVLFDSVDFFLKELLVTGEV